MGKLIWPCPGHPKVNSPYGNRIHPVTGKASFHGGIDINASTGVPIVAAHSGKVTHAGVKGTYGNLVILEGNGYKTYYAHQSKFACSAGQSISAGVVLGYVGATGRVTGAHLHFELYVNGTRVNPLSYVSSSDTAANYTGSRQQAEPTENSTDAAADATTETTVVHVPQVEKLYTSYLGDGRGKLPDAYQIVWKAYGGTGRDITSRAGNVLLVDDYDSVCTTLSLDVVGVFGETFLSPLPMQCGDLVSVTNTTTKECIFVGQIQRISGPGNGHSTVSCADQGRLLTCNDVILQCNNIAAKDAITQLAVKCGIGTTICPNLVSSVYDTFHDNAASILTEILETVTAENGVRYFPRVIGNTLVIKSFSPTCITPYFRQASNVSSFPVMNECEEPEIAFDIDDLRNKVSVYSEADDAVKVQATAQDDASISRYGLREMLETFSDSDSVTAAAKAKTILRSNNRIAEELRITTYGSDRVIAGVRLRVDLPGISGEYNVAAVTHDLGTPHRMTMTLVRPD